MDQAHSNEKNVVGEQPAVMMPAEPTDAMLLCLYGRANSRDIRNIDRHAAMRRYRALYAALYTPPPPRTKKVWTFYDSLGNTAYYFKHDSHEDAERNRNSAVHGPFSNWHRLTPIEECKVPA